MGDFYRPETTPDLNLFTEVTQKVIRARWTHPYGAGLSREDIDIASHEIIGYIVGTNARLLAPVIEQFERDLAVAVPGATLAPPRGEAESTPFFFVLGVPVASVSKVGAISGVRSASAEIGEAVLHSFSIPA